MGKYIVEVDGNRKISFPLRCFICGESCSEMVFYKIMEENLRLYPWWPKYVKVKICCHKRCNENENRIEELIKIFAVLLAIVMIIIIEL